MRTLKEADWYNTSRKAHTKETLEEGLSARDGCAMPKALAELRLGSKTRVAALATEMAILEWSKIKGKLETRRQLGMSRGLGGDGAIGRKRQSST